MTQQEQPPRTDALRAALDYLRDKLLDQHQHSQQWIEEAFREADARLAATPSPSSGLDVERITLLRGTLALIAEGREPAQEMADAALMRDNARLQREEKP